MGERERERLGGREGGREGGGREGEGLAVQLYARLLTVMCSLQ